MKEWRLLDMPPMTAAENMALDEVLLELKGKGTGPDTIRFLQFKPRAVLVGYHQSIDEEIRTGYCRANGIDVNRRITGGGAIFFDENQLGWEIICGKSFFNAGFSVSAIFSQLCSPVITALKRLGLPAAFRPRNDIEINGRKISGTGGTESGAAFLFQGTMLVDFDVETMLRSLRIPVEKLKAKEIDSVRERVTCLNWELGYTPDLEKIKDAIRYGFEAHLGIRLVPGGLTKAEQELFAEKVSDFQSEKWKYSVNPKFQTCEVVQSSYKTQDGLVRFSLVVNPARKRIKDIYITGDFLSFPPRSLYDLEAALRGMPLDRDKLYDKIQSFFDQDRIRIPGMGADDFFIPLGHVLEKISIADFGLSLDHCNRISIVNGSFSQIMRAKPSVLLLPYCAKQTDCDLRYKKGCKSCGDCSVGSAWDMGIHRQMRTICITSFEDLMDELKKMKDRGERAFIGCCCQPFFTKHIDDFRRIGIPGILLDIDNTTCYDLDQAKDAYAGNFESQTALDLRLVEAVLDVHV